MQYADSVIPAERYGEEGELDAAAIFLASDNAVYVNGIMLPVDGGYTCVYNKDISSVIEWDVLKD